MCRRYRIKFRVRIKDYPCFLISFVYSYYYFKKRQRDPNFVIRGQLDENCGLLIPDKHHTIASLNNEVEAYCLVPVIHIITNMSWNFFIIFVLQFQLNILKVKKMRNVIKLY